MTIEQWYKCVCQCGAVNWVCDGDPQDQTVCDVTGVRCWKCKRPSYFGEDDDLDMDPEDMDLGLEDGLEKPD